MTASVLRDGGFRPDINGLRAWAVLVVVFYHFGVPGFSGGFAGVDVFFVISGYLMAGIIVGGLGKGEFSLLDFYLSRARRIIPALLVVVLSVLILGWFLLMPHDYQMLGRHARESVFFMSNLRFMDEAGYFDSAANTKWLLHTWSLSVEWQFYLIYPLILLATQRVLSSARSLLCGHVLLLLVSFGLSVYLSQSEPEKAFFWLPSRAWELLLGSVVYFIGSLAMPAAQRRIVAMIGFALILYSVFWGASSLRWPGVWALPVVLGAGLVILAGDRTSWLTNVWPMQWLGERSYSLYLWHWPAVVLLAYLELEQRIEWVLLGILTSLLLSHISFQHVEMSSRRSLLGLSSRKAIVSLLLVTILVATCAQVVRRSGLPVRLPTDVMAVEQERKNRNPRQDECLDDEARCVFGGPQIRAFVLGDSHADAVITGVAAALKAPEEGVAFRADSGCLFAFNARRMDAGGSGCEALRRRALEEISALVKPVPVILINRTTAYALGHGRGEGHIGKPLVYFSEKPQRVNDVFLNEFSADYIESVCAFSKVASVYLMRPFPEMPVHVPRYMGRELLVHDRRAEVRITLAEHQARHAFTLALQDKAVEECGVKTLDPLPYLCEGNYCYGSEKGLPLYVDDDHLSERGNAKLIPLFRALLGSGS